MSNVEELLRPYVESTTLEQAERALDLLAGEETAPPRVLALSHVSCGPACRSFVHPALRRARRFAEARRLMTCHE